MSSASGDQLLRLPWIPTLWCRSLDGLAGATLTDVLADGNRALLIRAPAGNNSGPLELLDMESGETRILIAGAVVDAKYTDGNLVYVLSNGTLEAVPFDPDAGEIAGGPTTLGDRAVFDRYRVFAVDASDNGTVVYIPEEPRELILIDRDGRQRVLSEARQNFHSPMFSPDGQRIAVDFNSLDGRDVWVFDIRQQTMSRLTFDSDGHDPTWTSGWSGSHIYITKSGEFGIYVTPSTIRRGRTAGSWPRVRIWRSRVTGLPRDSTLLTIGNS